MIFLKISYVCLFSIPYTAFFKKSFFSSKQFKISTGSLIPLVTQAPARLTLRPPRFPSSPHPREQAFAFLPWTSHLCNGNNFAVAPSANYLTVIVMIYLLIVTGFSSSIPGPRGQGVKGKPEERVAQAVSHGVPKTSHVFHEATELMFSVPENLIPHHELPRFSREQR